MVVNEKALLAQMKSAYNSGGYTVAVREERHTIITGAWAVDIDSDNLPRDVIGLLAVHMGYLPKKGEAYKITKTKEGPAVQSTIYDQALAPIRALEQDVMDGVAILQLKKTELTFERRNVWQWNIGLGTVLIDPDLETLFRKKDDIHLMGDAFYAEGEISRAWVQRVRTDPEDPRIKCLSSIRWTA